MIPSFLWPVALAASLMWVDQLRPGPVSRAFTSIIFALGALSGALVVLN